MFYELGYEKAVGEYLINGIENANIKKSYVGVVTREQEQYWALIMIAKNGEVYYYSDYLENGLANHTAKKIDVSNKFVDVTEATYSYLNESELWETGKDIVLITNNGEVYSFENIIRAYM